MRVFTVYLLVINSICAINAITLQIVCKHYAIAVYLQALNKNWKAIFTITVQTYTCNYW